MPAVPSATSKKYAPWLWSLLALFCVRVVAQPLSRFDLPFLPSFERWHSGVVPYWSLLGCQLLIVAIFARIALRFTFGTVVARRDRGWLWSGVGAVYLVVMMCRLLLGFTIYRGHRWFDNPIPTFFHCALAMFFLVVGLFHLQNDNRGRAGDRASSA